MSEIDDYLRYYAKLKAPGYAVLVTGAWGVGKTHQVRAALGQEGHYYVSLNGLRTVEQVQSAIFGALSPNEEKLRRFLKPVEGALKDAGGAFAIAGSFAANIMNGAISAQIEADQPIVFDDLERCELDLVSTLGLIAAFIEVHQFPVVVIGNESEISRHDVGFERLKEKIFGQTLHAESQVAEAYDAFLDDHNHDRDDRTALETHRDTILATFQRSGVRSLRILRHVMQDTARLIACIPEDLRQEPYPIGGLIAQHVALDCEYRAGRLTAEEVAGFSTAVALSNFRKGKEGSRSAPREVFERHGFAYILHMPEHLIARMIVQGLYPANEIEAALSQSPTYGSPESEPPWLTIYRARERNPQQIETARDELCRRLDGDDKTPLGILLHEFSALLKLVRAGLIDLSEDDLVERFEARLTHLSDLGFLPAIVPDGRPDFLDHEGSHGYSFWSADDPRHDRISKTIKSLRDDAWKKERDRLARSLLGDLATDIDLFCGRITGDTDDLQLQAVPILHALHPDDFIAAWHGHPPEDWHHVADALRHRYDGAHPQLADETDWREALADALDAKAAAERDPVRAFLIRETTPPNLRPAPPEAPHG
ncbi:hypothetical protein [Roseobacter sp. HKCCA0434]|uniref:hypothetical protein n=1 Tax=Roseobacter sp. HKCCA0434 TaxID=3079297 RepID=UPI002905BFE0|nr:hypothetical protein [Roseobacter sp. HKCCA0434]